MRGDGFVFEVKYIRQRLDEKTIVEAVRTLGEKLGGRAYSMREWDLWAEKPCRAGTVMTRLGSWRGAMMAAGLVGGKRFRYGPEELMAELERVWRAMGRPPGTRSIMGHGISAGPYVRHWGSLRAACIALSRYMHGEITREAMLAGAPSARERWVRPRLRWLVLERDGHRCVGCGRGGAEGATLEIDHIVPVAAGGRSELSNLRVLCEACNRGRGAPGLRRDGNDAVRREEGFGR
jgi:5-methylcytosine-specific restriction endonuclease McrA